MGGSSQASAQMEKCVCPCLCVRVCFPDSESRGLSRRNDKSCGGKHQKVWCGTSVVRSHTVPGLLSLLWPPCHVASMRTKHPATVVSIQNQAALGIHPNALFLFFLFFPYYHKANRSAGFFFAWLLFFISSRVRTWASRKHRDRRCHFSDAIQIVSAMWSVPLSHFSHTYSGKHSWEIPKKKKKKKCASECCVRVLLLHKSASLITLPF